MPARWETLTIVALAAGLVACDAEETPPPCPSPNLTPHLAAGTYQGERERAAICIKAAVHRRILLGGPPAEAGRGALDECASQEAAAIAALAKLGPVWPYQKATIHDEFSHLANVAAVQARSRGCGRRKGEAADTL